MKPEVLSVEKVKQETGIDLEQYRTDVVADSISELLESPLTVLIHVILWPLLIVIASIVSALWLIWPLSWAGAILWILTGLLVGPFTGLAIAMYLIASGLSETSKNLYESVLDTVKVIAEDLKTQHSDSQKQHLPTFKEWLQIIRLALVVPALRQIIRRRLWPVGDPIANFLVQTLTKSETKGLAEIPVSESQIEVSQNPEKYSQQIIEKCENLKKSMAKVHERASSLTLRPLRFSMFMSLGFNILLFLLILYFFVF